MVVHLEHLLRADGAVDEAGRALVDGAGQGGSWHICVGGPAGRHEWTETQ